MEPAMEPRVPERVAEFRRRYRAEQIPARYRGWAHLSFTSVGSLAAIALAAASVHEVSAFEWLTVPLTFLFANFAEYAGHRGPMHHKRRGMQLLHERHTLQHHRFYTHDAMQAESSTDFHMVLFPPVLLIFFLGLLATPIGFGLFLVTTANVGWLFVATAVGYFLTYEWLHFAYHLPTTSWVARLPLMGRLRQHHTHHHNARWMGRYNFNITFPIADRVFGTVFRAGSR
ncbi:MAG: sterol desaturase family protein [Myxococcota bacterium]